MREILSEGKYFGANITGREGGSTGIICVKVGNSVYRIIEVDSHGVATKNKLRGINLISFQDIGALGLLMLHLPKDRLIKPGNRIKCKVGSHTLIIKATKRRGVRLNRKKPIPGTDKLYDQIFPDIKK